MKEEVSAGIILFNDNEDRKFLLLNYPSKHWDFVKGKMEKDETPHETALRETKEETGISDVRMLDDWQMRTFYTFTLKGKEVEKEVFWFIGETDEYEITLSHEHRNFMWLEWDDAENQLNFDQSKEVLRGARAQLRALGREL